MTSSAATTGNGFHILNGFDGGSLTSCYAQDNARAGFYFNGAGYCVATALNADSNNNNSSGTSFVGFDIDAFSGPLSITSSWTYDRGANAQPQAACVRIASTNASQQCLVEFSWASSATMSTLLSADTNLSTNTLIVNGETAVGVQLQDFSASVTPNPQNGSTMEITLTGNITIANPADNTYHMGSQLTFIFIQDATGGRTVTWGTAYNVFNFTPATGANKQNVITFTYDGTNWMQTAAVIHT